MNPTYDPAEDKAWEEKVLDKYQEEEEDES